LVLAVSAGPVPVFPIPIPGGVAAPEGRTAYVVGALGQLEALDLESGRTSWAAEGPRRPLLVWDARLVTETTLSPNRLRIDVLDTGRNGQRILESEAVVFPDWVAIDGPSFSHEAHIAGSTLYLSWRASARYEGGAPPPKTVLEAARKSAAGQVLVDLKAGRVEMRAQDATPGTELPQALAEMRSFPYEQGDRGKTEPLVSGGYVAALDLKESASGPELVLTRWSLETGLTQGVSPIAAGRPLRVLATLDGRFVLVRSGGEMFRAWSVETGQPVEGELALDPGTRAATLLGRRLYTAVESPVPKGEAVSVSRTLTVLDLESGQVLWQHPLQALPTAPRPRRRP
jgi:hypothetical protein